MEPCTENFKLPEGNEAALIAAAQLTHRSFTDLTDINSFEHCLLDIKRSSQCSDEEWRS